LCVFFIFGRKKYLINYRRHFYLFVFLNYVKRKNETRQAKAQSYFEGGGVKKSGVFAIMANFAVQIEPNTTHRK
jgi:hypothetical protein